MTDRNTEPCDLSAVAARAAIGARQITAVDLLESCIARIERVDHAVNAVCARDFAAARTMARKADDAVKRGDRLGPLHGLPLGVKDLIDAEGLPTTFGSPLFRDNIAKRDEAIVGMLKRAGAIVVGKTNVPEWGAGGNTRNALHGATGNPFDPTRSAAGSSGGSAVALATGMVPLATGSDTGGSVRNPAAYCGVVGFRPSPGLIASDSRNMAWLQISQLGPMARRVDDLCLMLSAMIERDGRDPQSAILHAGGEVDPGRYATPPPVDLATLRVAVTPDFGFAPTERMMRETFASRIAGFGDKFRTLRHEHPDCTDADEVFEILRAVAFLGLQRELVMSKPEQVGANIRAQITQSLGYSAVDVARAMSKQTAMYRRWQAFFADVDVILAPAMTVGPRPWMELYPATIDGQPTRSYFHWLALAYAVTNVGHPVVALPCGRDAAGLPFGIQVIGARGADVKTLAVARALEQVFATRRETARPVPDLARLAAAPPISAMPGFKSAE